MSLKASKSPSSPITLSGRKVWVAGHRGMAGSAILRRLEREGAQVLTVGRSEVDLRRQGDVEAWLARNSPELVFVAAGTVGGIHANSTRPAEFLYDNMMIAANIIHGAREVGVDKLVYLSSNCIYPRLAAQPMGEDALLTGALEPTNQWYALAKISGLKMCQAYRQQYGCNFIAVIPSSLYGVGDNYDLMQGHVCAAMIARFHDAKVKNLPEVVLWGGGTPTREFLDADDMADGVVFLAKHYEGDEPINLGTGRETSIRQLAELVAEVVGYGGKLVWDTSKPEGMPRKFLNSSRMKELGWQPATSLEDGFRRAYAWYVDNACG